LKPFPVNATPALAPPYFDGRESWPSRYRRSEHLSRNSFVSEHRAAFVRGEPDGTGRSALCVLGGICFRIRRLQRRFDASDFDCGFVAFDEARLSVMSLKNARQAASLRPLARKAKLVKLLDPSVRLVAGLVHRAKISEAPTWKLSLNVPLEIDA
jgi:hypothetical protein